MDLSFTFSVEATVSDDQVRYDNPNDHAHLVVYVAPVATGLVSDEGDSTFDFDGGWKLKPGEVEELGMLEVELVKALNLATANALLGLGKPELDKLSDLYRLYGYKILDEYWMWMTGRLLEKKRGSNEP